MKTKVIALLAVFLVAPACASAPPEGGGVRSISYETGPCFGACPVYRVVVNVDGSGRFEGRRFTAVEGQRGFAVTPGQWRAFVARLAPYRPSGAEAIGPGHPRCQMQATDHPSATVTWSGAGGEDRLAFYYGCRDAENAALARALREAPGLLPIGDLIGPNR